MKKLNSFILPVILVVSILAFAGCSSTNTSASTTDSAAVSSVVASSGAAASVQTAAVSTAAATTAAAATQKTFTLDELKAFDGLNGNPAYVALDGTVYDVTLIAAWLGGEHQGMTAGQDISDKIGSSPHGKTVLENLTVVGTLEG